MKFEADNLKTVKNYAAMNKVTTTYIYKLIRDKRMDNVIVDGVQFVDITKHPKLPVKG